MTDKEARPDHFQENREVPRGREEYDRAVQLAASGAFTEADRAYRLLQEKNTDTQLSALIVNDVAALAALRGHWQEACLGFQQALGLDREMAAARQNLETAQRTLPTPSEPAAVHDPVRVAIVSFLFNWPSTGGGNVHTEELVRFLDRAGFAVRHFFVRYADWGIGQVAPPLPLSEPIEFSPENWLLDDIKQRIAAAVRRFDPDYVIVTDSWNMKPHLADALRDYPVLLRFQGMEVLCPLNNVRLLVDPGGSARQCQQHQLATPQACQRCVGQRGGSSGILHQRERALSGVGSISYQDLVFRTLEYAEAVLVVNPVQQTMFSPHAQQVHVVTAGMDSARFRWPPPESHPREKTVLLFAGLVDEFMKGYRVLHAACSRLWSRRRDFELWATADPVGQQDEFTRFIGWQPQESLPEYLHQADVLVMPTIAQEALGRTAVEAMAAGRAVIASRLGGLPYTVADGMTGLLFAPNDEIDLAAKINRLLDDPPLRQRLGWAGRQRFEEHYEWQGIVARHYRPLLHRRRHRDPNVRRLFDAYPWPRHKPAVELPTEHLGWFEDGARELLNRQLSSATRLVLELGAWLGMSTRFIADHAPHAVVVTVDHWQGSPEHQHRPEWRGMLDHLFEKFLALSWSYRHHVLPLKMTILEGLHVVASFGLKPDLIYLDAEHEREAVLAQLDACRRLFPTSLVVGDDFDDPQVQAAVRQFAVNHGRDIAVAGKNWKAWQLNPNNQVDSPVSVPCPSNG